MKYVVETPMYGIMKQNLAQVTTTTENKVRWSYRPIAYGNRE